MFYIIALDQIMITLADDVLGISPPPTPIGSIMIEAESTEQMEALRVYLNIIDNPYEHHTKADGSCQWIDARDDFQDWRDCSGAFASEDETIKSEDNKNVSILWVYANPGTGKSVLASHVVSQLQKFRLECAYHYFHSGNTASQSFSAFLRSIAYQMASSNAAVRQRLFALDQEGASFDRDDSRSIWTKVFRKGVLTVSLPFPRPCIGLSRGWTTKSNNNIKQ